MASSSSSRPHSTPMPVGPHILWAEKAMKSAPIACTSVGTWGTYWQASTIATAPWACAASASWRTGLIVPSTFDMAVKPNALAPSSSRSRSVRSSRPSGGERHPAQLDAALGGEDVPRHDVGVVLHLGEHDDVALAQVRAAPRVGDEVEPLGGVLREDHLALARRVDEPLHLQPRGLVGLGRLAGELVHAAVHVARCTSRSSAPSRRAPAGASARSPPSRGRRGACR